VSAFKQSCVCHISSGEGGESDFWVLTSRLLWMNCVADMLCYMHCYSGEICIREGRQMGGGVKWTPEPVYEYQQGVRHFRQVGRTPWPLETNRPTALHLSHFCSYIAYLQHDGVLCHCASCMKPWDTMRFSVGVNGKTVTCCIRTVLWNGRDLFHSLSV